MSEKQVKTIIFCGPLRTNEKYFYKCNYVYKYYYKSIIGIFSQLFFVFYFGTLSFVIFLQY